jgi:surfeit locus 1 family protein
MLRLPRHIRAPVPSICRLRRQGVSSDASRPSGQLGKPRRMSPTTLVLGFIPILAFGLGTWQVQRLRWKVALIEELKDAMQREPMTLPKKIK